VLFGRRCVAPILLQLAQKYPRLELVLSFSDHVTNLAEHGYDFAIRTGTIENRADIVIRRVARQRMVVCAAPSYLEAHGRPECVEDLGRHQAIVYNRSGPVRPWQGPACDAAARSACPVAAMVEGPADAL
jgi:DNA-binding transcriptional LysR family regulator